MASESLKIGKRVFLTSVTILLALMMIAGIMTQLIQQGVYQREIVEGTLRIIPDTYQEVTTIHYPVWRWFTAPIEVLFSEGAMVLVVILLFLLIVGGAVSILNKCGVIQVAVDRAIHRFENNQLRLMYVLTLLFMAFGAFVGIFEEVVPIVPIILVLSLRLGWDRLTGLGMSILAAGFGFSAAVSNPFTIGVAQELAELPVFSGAGYRVIIFIVYYVVLVLFLKRHIKSLEQKDPAEIRSLTEETLIDTRYFTNQSMVAFVSTLGAIVLLLLSSNMIPVISGIAMPLVALIFLFGGLASGGLSKLDNKGVVKAFVDGVLGVAPAIVLILMAASVKFIIDQGGILDTILYQANRWIGQTNSIMAVYAVFLLVLVLNFFIGSGSAKAFLLMPIIVPLADLLTINRQIMVLAFQFGDGFSNILYPTNPVLLIALGVSAVSYQKWFKFTLGLQLMTLVLNLIFLGIATLIAYGPY